LVGSLTKGVAEIFRQSLQYSHEEMPVLSNGSALPVRAGNYLVDSSAAIPQRRFLSNAAEIGKADGEFRFTVPIGWSFPIQERLAAVASEGELQLIQGSVRCLKSLGAMTTVLVRSDLQVPLC